MKKTILLFSLSVNLFCYAADTDQQTLNISNRISSTLSLLSAGTVDLTVRNAQAGSGLIKEVKFATNMCITTNEVNKKLIAYLNLFTPNQTKLEITVDSAPGINQTPKILSPYPTDLLTNISNVDCASTKISFKYSADPSDGVILEETYTVTYILTDM